MKTLLCLILAVGMVGVLQAKPRTLAAKKKEPAWQQKSDRLRKERKYSQAVQAIEKAAAGEPKKDRLVDALIRVARAAAEHKDKKNALKALESAVAIQPSSVKAHTELGRNYFYLADRNEDAAREYRKAITLDPAQEEPYLLLAGALNVLKKHEERVQVLTQFLQVLKKEDPLRPDMLAERAESEAALGKHQEAVNDWKQAQSLSPDLFKNNKWRQDHYQESLRQLR